MTKDLPILFLITEDLITKLFIKKQLQSKYQIVEKRHFLDIIDTIKNLNVDLVIIDGSIESFKPLDLLEKLRRKERLILTPMIFITSRLKKSFEEKAKKKGASFFLHKPLEESELNTIIENINSQKKRHSKISNLSQRLNKGKS